MNRNRLLHIVLAIIGIGALLAYLVACRPSWSPDGSKVLFPYLDPKTEVAGIALFDRNTGKTESVFVLPPGKRSDDVPVMPWAQWDRAGQKAIVLWVEEDDGPDELHVVLVAIESKKPTRTFVVRDAEVLLGSPVPEAASALLVGGDSLIRLDLTTGNVERRKLEGQREVVLASHKDKIWYCGKVRGPRRGDYEIGTVDPKELALEPALTLREKDVGEISPFLAVAKDGSAIAMSSQKEKKYQLLIVAGNKLQKAVPLELSSETHELGNLELSPDGKTIYAAVAAKVKDQELVQLAIGEITVDTGTIRVTPLLRLRKTPDPDLLFFYFQIALSPDGKTIATSPTYLFEEVEDKGDCALHLVDLTSPERKVTKIPVPIARDTN